MRQAGCHRAQGGKALPILLEVRETNLSAQLFFRNSGFKAVSVLREFYDDTPEDAYVMQYRCQEEAPDVIPFNRIARLAG